MAPERPLSPEKQLLKLIEEPGLKQAGISGQALHHIGLNFFTSGAWLGRLSFLKEKLKKIRRGSPLPSLDVKVLNGVLAVCIFVMGFYFVSHLSVSLMRLKDMPRFNFTIKNPVEAIVDFQQNLMSGKAAAYYSEKVRQRDIFKMGAKAPSADAPAADAPAASSSKILEATQHLRLVGISWSKDPDAMIEDTRALRTLFVRRGQTIGDIKVQAILKDKVILIYGGEETELK